uniref:Permuted papain-like amidase enzyme, YaeF/YiiX, C92 family n=1 Tax=Candidatus Kentrum sp. TUN TaxID=2126343 RepID=A0A451A6J4_9GAMM|nr:MAG: hypothetical protein BECKTUN1418F_GA0071002_11452 [Candidatus Kentron sp. TUN]VFK61646.1 MAG: hypothetical protein BECKTUN1418D_GA0071000_115610 [Candidatus Kentron sp. TUN]VFK67351.1 MAG: hypothetical protein BECKTUN1418E_GA0071001_11432 [Candidatus Kentron sp. TUN]
MEMNHLTKDNYARGREYVRSGDVFVWTGNRLIQRIIQRRMKGRWYHVGAAWVANKRVLILEARLKGGVIISPLSRRLDCYHVPSGVEWTKEKDEFAFSHIGDPYSITDALLTGLRLDTFMPGYHCLEFVRDLLNIPDANTLVDVVEWAQGNYQKMLQVN